MMKQWNEKPLLRKTILDGLFVPTAVWAGTQLSVSAPVMQAAPSASDETDGGASHSRSRVYSVINLGPEAGATALLNEKGQAAFGSINYYGVVNSFFDGDKLHPIGSLGGGYTWVNGLNKSGVVTGESQDNSPPFGDILVF